MKISEAHVQAFRGRRGHLTGEGAGSLVDTARAVVGIQAQVDTWARWSLSLRTAGRPTAEAVEAELLDTRALVRLWTQRDTLHIYPADDWPWVAAADPLWSMSGRRGVLPSDDLLDRARKRLKKGPVTRSHLFDLITPEMEAEMAERTGPEQAKRFAAGRIPWRLSHLGELSLGPKDGAEQSYVSRGYWLPKLPFPKHSTDAAATELTRRYLAVNGPATPQDVAHYFGAKVTIARKWLANLGDELSNLDCGGRKDLVLLTADLPELQADRTPTPPRLLAAYDTLLMAHADKTWTTGDDPERKAVWRPSAVVAAVVIAAGKVAATWTYKKRAKSVVVTVKPLSKWKKGYAKALHPDADAFARHLGVADFDLVVEA